MDEPSDSPQCLNRTAAESAGPLRALPQAASFRRVDWLAFGVAAALMFLTYGLTLSSDVGLDNSGLFAVAAFYNGVPMPPGYPVWTISAHLFTRLLPFSNIACRLSVFSALVSSVTCGLIALMVSRCGAMLLEGMRGFRRLDAGREMLLCAGCGVIAGSVFGLSGMIWIAAVSVTPWPLTLLLLAIVLCLLTRWSWAPGRNRWLYAACLMYGVTLTNSQAMITAAFGLVLFAALFNARLGRDLFFGIALSLTLIIIAPAIGLLGSFANGIHVLRPLYVVIISFSFILFLALSIRTRHFLTEWKIVLVGMLLVVAGMLFYLVPSIASMCTPPMNWAYPRTTEGFFNLITRGQYEKANPGFDLDNDPRFGTFYWIVTTNQFGLPQMVMAAIPFCFLHKMRGLERRWLLGLAFVFFCLTGLMLILLNPALDRATEQLEGFFLTASFEILSVWAGLGMILLGTRMGAGFETVTDAAQTAPAGFNSDTNAQGEEASRSAAH